MGLQELGAIESIELHPELGRTYRWGWREIIHRKGVAFAALCDARESDVVAGSVEEPLIVLFAQARNCQCSDAVSRACIEKARSEETAHECRAGELPIAGKLFKVVRARIELQSSKSSGGSRSLTRCSTRSRA